MYIPEVHFLLSAPPPFYPNEGGRYQNKFYFEEGFQGVKREGVWKRKGKAKNKETEINQKKRWEKGGKGSDKKWAG